MRTRWRNLLASTTANFATLAALVAPVAIALAALAVDEASLYVERREAQSITDLAAIAAAQAIGDARAAALATFGGNGITAVFEEDDPGTDRPRIRVETGRYTPDPDLPVDQRFTADAPSPNAARVTFHKTGNIYFAQLFSRRPEIATSAIASRQAMAAFSVGSRLARLDGGLLNAILGGLTGSQISLDVMDYDALLASDIDLLSFFGVLATQLDLQAATYDELLDAKVNVSQVAAALAGVEGLSARAVSALDALANRTDRPSAGDFSLSNLIDLGVLGAIPVGSSLGGLDAKLDALQIIAAAAAIANGENQVHADLGAGIPGLLGASLDLAIGEPPQGSAWFAIGDGGEIVRTAQTRLRLVVQIGGPGGALGASIRVPLYLDLAYAEARLASVSCPTGRPESLEVKVDARPGIADLRLADMDASRLADFRNPIPLRPAALVTLPLVQASGSAHAGIGDRSFTSLTFDHDDVEAGTVRTVATTDLTQSLFATLLGDLDLQVEVAGLDLGLSSLLATTLGGVLQGAAPAIDDLLLDVLSTLGLSLGEADVAVTGATCGRAVLVQ
jgi:uncharacterized membrane protein